MEDVNRRYPQILRILSAFAVVAAAVLATAIGASPASAEDPSVIAEAVSEDGVFVAPGRSEIDEAELEAVVQNLRFQALRVVVVAPNDPQPSSAAFARRIQEATDADIAIVFPPESEDEEVEVRVEAFVIDDLQENHYRALQEARGFSDPARSVEAFGKEIQAEREVERPAIIGQLLWALALMGIGLIVIFGLERAVAAAKSKSSTNGQITAPGPPAEAESAKVTTASSEAR